MRHMNDAEIESAREAEYAFASGENDGLERVASDDEVAEALALEEQMSRAHRFTHRAPWGFR